ncbi:nucleophile aminohydrolase [Triangularia verruculosa]|uniref:Proteasome subunit beta n=1 Tax=Triangularia verruculosa TaxID=2587418 RepID=A0AAN7ASK2_9PEZI|nr:nucleophile aminohydrolase [Triangularia verruculosa]
MDHRPQAWGRPRDDVYGAYDGSYLNNSGPRTVTQSPVVTGTSVIAIKYKDGVVMAADNLASYGSLARFTDVKRLRTFLDTSVIGFGGDVSDMQFLDRHLKELATDESYEAEPTVDEDDEESSSKPGHLNAGNLFKYLQKLMYQRRNSFDPLWNQLLVAGFDSDSKPFLASVDLRGTSFTSPSLATGFGAALAQPIMRKYAATEEDAANLTREQAVEVVKECMKVLYYRDARSLDRYSIAVVSKDGIELKEDEQLERQSWAFAERIKGYGTQTV